MSMGGLRGGVIWGTLIGDEAPAVVLHGVGEEEGRGLSVGPFLVRLDSRVHGAGHLLEPHQSLFRPIFKTRRRSTM